MMKFVELPGGKLKRVKNRLFGPGWNDNGRDPEIDNKRVAERLRIRVELKGLCRNGVLGKNNTVVKIDDELDTELGTMNACGDSIIELDNGDCINLVRDPRTGMLLFASVQSGDRFAF